ncbi:MAG: single-stranded-DNA-specific exonuclease RecJ, partial [Alteromonadaceae bacterium]
WIKEEALTGVILSDGDLPVNDMTLAFAEKVRDCGPWGQNFSEPLFDDEFTLIQQRIVGEKHLKIVVQKQGQVFDGIAFNVDVQVWPNVKAEKIHLAYRLDVNEFRGKRTVQLMVESITTI